jgi:hypothetical protein
LQAQVEAQADIEARRGLTVENVFAPDQTDRIPFQAPQVTV